MADERLGQFCVRGVWGNAGYNIDWRFEMTQTKNDWNIQKLIRQDKEAIKAFLIESLILIAGSFLVWCFCVFASIWIVWVWLVYDPEPLFTEECASAGGCGLAILFFLGYIAIILAIFWLFLQTIFTIFWLIARSVNVPLIILDILTVICFGIIFFLPSYTSKAEFIVAAICFIGISATQILVGHLGKRLSQRLFTNKPLT